MCGVCGVVCWIKCATLYTRILIQFYRVSQGMLMSEKGSLHFPALVSNTLLQWKGITPRMQNRGIQEKTSQDQPTLGHPTI
jgi:hypothetical protein